MNKIAIVVIGLGVIVTLAGIILLSGIGERTVEKIEEGVLKPRSKFPSPKIRLC